MAAPIIIDVEASGFGQGSYPIEIGLVLPDGTPHCFLVAPERGWTDWDPEAERVHGISREVAVCHGRPVSEVAWRLNALLRAKTVYSDAWSFDMCWIGKLYDAAHERQRFRIAPLHELVAQDGLERWDQTRDQVVHDLALKRHRASGDARILQETWRRLHACAA
jgi:hypothetical protein